MDLISFTNVSSSFTGFLLNKTYTPFIELPVKRMSFKNNSPTLVVVFTLNTENNTSTLTETTAKQLNVFNVSLGSMHVEIADIRCSAELGAQNTIGMDILSHVTCVYNYKQRTITLHT